MTRKERFKKQRELEKIKGIGGDGLKVAVSDEVKCDECGEPKGTLYGIDGRMVCYNHLPIEWLSARKSAALLNQSASGSDAIRKARRQLAHGTI